MKEQGTKKENENTHIVFHEGAVHVSPNLMSITNFVGDIESEIDELFSVSNRFSEIFTQYKELLKCTEEITGLLGDKKNDIKFNFSEPPQTILNKIKWSRPLRAEFLTVFAYIETLMCFYVAYSNEISNEKEIRKKMRDDKVIKKFINTFILHKDNIWYQMNYERAKRFNWKELRYMRNSLSHFFSVANGGLSACTIYDETVQKTETDTKNSVRFISPDDLRIMARGAGLLLLNLWDKECRSSIQLMNKDFEKKIKFVKTIVDQEASLKFFYNQLK